MRDPSPTDVDKGDEHENDTVVENLNIVEVVTNKEAVGNEDHDGEAVDDESIEDLACELEELIENVRVRLPAADQGTLPRC
ncbi:hypothetical protein BG003_010695 [Podila horticola]|nr:hypothetical protein BG003_010695 [Podila horticola]